MRAFLLWVSLGLTGCLINPTIRVESPEAVALETRHYDQAAPSVQRAAVVALKSLGYEVIRGDAGRVRTAPKVISVQAVQTAYRATAVDSSIAWDVHVTSATAGTTVRAVPRAYTGGQEMAENTPFDKVWFDAALANFYREVDDALGAAPAAALEPPKADENPAPRKKRGPKHPT